MNLVQVSLFSNLITIPFQCCEFCVGVVWTQLFFTGFKVGIIYPYVTCQTDVADNDNSILCDLCDKRHHTICVNVSNTNYEKLKVDLNPWLCSTCAEEITFFDLAKKDLKNLLSNIFPEKSVLRKVDQKTKIYLKIQRTKSKQKIT